MDLPPELAMMLYLHLLEWLNLFFVSCAWALQESDPRAALRIGMQR